ncbi:tRNA (guanosine(37)-N1)-methyltransferase TrmD [bacterium]|nr:tRNA (guanosine(37)-N1)-methyltransferase TrmD [bacterium]
MIIEIITLFPDGVRTMLSESMLARAQNAGAVDIEYVQLRKFATDKHGTVDDKPFGGGPGMVLKAEPVARALEHLSEKRPTPKPRVLYTSPQGRRFDQAHAEELAGEQRITILCGHYKGLDQRALDTLIDEEVSIGDFILTGGEPAAVVIVDAVVRLLPGVLGDPESARGDSFTRGLLDHPHYTQPADWRGLTPPEVLLSGHHAKVEQWRQEQAERATRERRPELYERWLARKGEKPSW